jgi:hypothetical protein
VTYASGDELAYLAACLSAGAILTGFCGTFLSFRIQREANYYRQPVLDFESETAKDVVIDRTHFSSPFLLLIIGTLMASGFGFISPLLAISGIDVSKMVIVSGMIAAMVTILGYFVCELVHYRVLNTRLINDKAEWGRSSGVVIGTLAAAGSAAWAVIRAWPN